MANRSIAIPKAHLIMALCLPLAVLIGYMLAEPMDGGTFAVVTLVLGALTVPLLMNWYHTLLILAWNSYVIFAFLPGPPQLWMVMAPVALLFAMLNRAVNPDQQFVSVPSITRSLLFFLGVLVVTAYLTGGIGLRSMGGSHYGSRNYIYMFIAIAGYFALSSQRISVERAPLYVALFFLVGLTSIIPHLLYYIGPRAFFLFQFFPSGLVSEQIQAEMTIAGGIFRLNGLQAVGPAIYCFLLARYGIRGLLDMTRPWRGLLYLTAVTLSALSGFRSALLIAVLTFAAQFYFEGLHRTRLLPALLAVMIATSAVFLPITDKLPLVIQRSLAFLPLKLDPMAVISARTTSEWRIEMWKLVLPDIPKYFFKGKGYSIDPNQMYLANYAATREDRDVYATRLVGDYHNGPLSVIIPLGIWGVVGFGWFLAASCRLLYRYAKHGDPRLQRINTALLAIFVGRMIFFIFVFGGVNAELYVFTGLVGLAVSLNGLPAEKVEEEETEPETVEAFG